MMGKRGIGYLLAALATAIVACMLFGCTRSPVPSPEVETIDVDTDASDQMFDEDVSGYELYVFQIDNTTCTTDYFYTVDANGESLKDGGFYKLVVDATLLNGGIAGYVDYPEIHYVESCEKVSPLEIGLPSIEEGSYGLHLIGDYADGDVLLDLYSYKGVWKNGKWVYRYDGEIKLDDDTQAIIREGVTESEVQSGIEDGVLSCEDYFVLPSENTAD